MGLYFRKKYADHLTGDGTTKCWWTTKRWSRKRPSSVCLIYILVIYTYISLANIIGLYITLKNPKISKNFELHITLKKKS